MTEPVAVAEAAIADLDIAAAVDQRPSVALYCYSVWCR
jgi:hypothetical protein